MKINKAALDQAGAARKQYRADTPVPLYSIEGEDAVFVAAYLEATHQPVDRIDIQTRISMWSMRPQPGTPEGEAWEQGCRQGYEWGKRSPMREAVAREELEDGGA